MLRHILCLVLLMVATATLAEDYVALDANFDLDTIGDWPSPDLPGGPDGDTLEYDGRLNGDETTAHVQASWFTLDAKPLVIDRQVGENITLIFNFDPLYTECDSYTLTWSSGAGNPLEYAYFTLHETDWTLLASLDYRVDGVLTYNSPTNVLSTGWSVAVPQDFRLEVNPSERASDLWIDEVPVPEAQGARLMHALPDGTLGRIALHFGYSSAAIMSIDNLLVVAHCDGVPNETANWGSIKALYR